MQDDLTTIAEHLTRLGLPQEYVTKHCLRVEQARKSRPIKRKRLYDYVITASGSHYAIDKPRWKPKRARRRAPTPE